MSHLHAHRVMEIPQNDLIPTRNNSSSISSTPIEWNTYNNTLWSRAASQIHDSEKIVYDFFFSHSIFFPLLAAVGESSVNVFSYKRHNYAVVVFSPSTKLHSSSKENCFFFIVSAFLLRFFSCICRHRSGRIYLSVNNTLMYVPSSKKSARHRERWSCGTIASRQCSLEDEN